jgi:hypothetical protein
MVYSAMKLFMEINPSLFDECTSDYAALQESAPQRQAERESVWKALEEKASRKRKIIEASGHQCKYPMTVRAIARRRWMHCIFKTRAPTKG